MSDIGKVSPASGGAQKTSKARPQESAPAAPTLNLQLTNPESPASPAKPAAARLPQAPADPRILGSLPLPLVSQAARASTSGSASPTWKVVGQKTPSTLKIPPNSTLGAQDKLDQVTTNESVAAIEASLVDANGDPAGAGAVSAAVLAEIQQNPEQAEEILAGAQESLGDFDQLLAEAEPDEWALVVKNFSQVAEVVGPEGAAALGETLAGGGDELIVALATASPSPGLEALEQSVAGALGENAGQEFLNTTQTVRDQVQTIAAAEGPQAVSAALAAASSANPELSQLILQAAAPQLDQAVANLENLDPEQAQQVIQQLAAVAQTSPESAAMVADLLQRHLVADQPELLAGLTQASLVGDTLLVQTFLARANEAGQAELAANFDSVLKVQAYHTEFERLLEAGDLESAARIGDMLMTMSENSPPAVTGAFLHELERSGQLDQFQEFLGANAEQVDRSTLDDNLAYTQGWNEGAVHFDRALAGLTQALSFADDPELTREVGEDFARIIANVGIGRFDEAFQIGVAQGRGADLAVEVAIALEATGSGAADNVVNATVNGLSDLSDRYNNNQEKADQVYRDLAYLDHQFAGGGDNEAAARAFLDAHPEVAEAQRMGGSIGGDLEALERLTSEFPELESNPFSGFSVRPDEVEASLLASFPNWSSTERGQVAVTDALAATSQGESTFLDRLGDPDVLNRSFPPSIFGPDQRQEYLTAVSESLTRSAFSGAAAGLEQGQSPSEAFQALDGIGQIAHVETLTGVSAEDWQATSEDAQDAIQQLVAEGVGQETIDALNDILPPNAPPGLQRGFQAGSFLIGAVALGLSESETTADDLQLLVDTLGLTSSGLANIAEIGLGAGTVTAGTVQFFHRASIGLGVASAGFDLIRGLQQIEDGETAQGALSIASAGGGFLAAGGAVFASGAATGIGAVIAIGAAIGTVQLARVQASNRLENGETLDYLRALLPPGTPERTLEHLSNADRNGVHAGIALQAVAQELGIPFSEFLAGIAELDPDLVGELIEAAHGVVSNSTNTVEEVFENRADDDGGGYIVLEPPGGGRDFPLAHTLGPDGELMEVDAPIPFDERDYRRVDTPSGEVWVSSPHSLEALIRWISIAAPEVVEAG